MSVVLVQGECCRSNCKKILKFMWVDWTECITFRIDSKCYVMVFAVFHVFDGILGKMNGCRNCIQWNRSRKTFFEWKPSKAFAYQMSTYSFYTIQKTEWNIHSVCVVRDHQLFARKHLRRVPVHVQTHFSFRRIYTETGYTGEASVLTMQPEYSSTLWSWFS